MRASKKTSVDPTPVDLSSEAGRYTALREALSGGIPITDVLDAAKQVMADRLAREREAAPNAPQPAPKPGKPAPKPATAFDLQRTLARPTATAPAFDQPWIDQPTAGPADLIRHFAIAAVTEHRPEIADYDEKSYSLIMDVAEFAIDVALRLAGVAESWADEYRALTAYLHE